MHPGRAAHASHAKRNLISTLALILPLALVTATGGATTVIGEPHRILLAADSPQSTARSQHAARGTQDSAREPEVRLLTRQADRLEIEFALPALEVQSLEIEGRRYDVLEIPGGGVSGSIGEPMLPTFSRLIQIPDQAGVTFEVTSVETTELTGCRPIPMQPEEGAQFAIDRAAYTHHGFLGDEPVQIGEPAIARDLRLIPISFHPVRYDPSRGVIEIARRITVRVRFAGVDLRNARTRTERIAPGSFRQLYRSLVINYEEPRDIAGTSLGMNVIICPDNASVVAALEPLVAWRMRKGFDVYLATTAETGSSAGQIQAWLRDAYETWESPPEYITLIGDSGGSISIPSWGNSDHEYSQLDGGDILADANVGRISVASIDQLQLYVNKIVGYESTPYMEETDWYTDACVTGDPGGSGQSCIQIMQWLKTRLLEYGYTEVDTVFSSPWVTQMTNSMNQGVGIFAYRGYMGMSGFDDGDVNALQNGWKLIYAVNITCYTGTFDGGTSISETWIRAGLPPSTPTGGIASVGTATAGTHTRYNNCMMYGIWRGVYWEDLFTFGESFTRGTYELYVNYIQGDPGAVSTWSRYNNLMGDPAGELWTGVPEPMLAAHPNSVPLGANSVTVTATLHGAPVPGAFVCLWKEGETRAGGVTGADGSVELAVDLRNAGDLLVTVTKHDHHPYLAAIPVEQANRFVGHSGHTIDDDTVGSSSGNGDGLVNPTERIELPVRVQNMGTQMANDVTGTLTCDDPYVTILDDSEEFGDLLPGQMAWSADDFDLELAGGAPSGHVIRLGLDLASGTDSWHSLIDLPVTAAAFIYDDFTFYGPGGQIDPGEAGQLSVAIANIGDATGSSVTADLISRSPWVTVTDAVGTYGNMGIGGSGENTDNRFAISVSQECYPGHLAEMALHLSFSAGARDTVAFLLPVGSASTTDPTGPDIYGYYAFDNTDTDYLDAPVYEWIEIAPNHGGPGEDVGLSDNGGWADDDSRTVDLPFPFAFYGETFTRVTICSNGWLSMGATYLENRRNWNIPAAGAPPYLIAPMWDNLYQDGEDKVYHWYDESNHRYIVQWSRVRNYHDGSIDNFEAILHDPEHYPTASGDGEIIFQYEEFHNSDTIQHYCTVGIENGDQTDGVMYSYFNRYNAGAATIPAGGGRAIKFTPLSAAPRGILTGVITNETNGGTPLAGATVTLLEAEEELTSDAEGIYRGVVPAGIHTLVASHPSFAADTMPGVWIVEGQTTEQDFSLTDILPPAFVGTVDLPNTGDDQGPYPVTTTVIEYSDLASLSLFYNPRGTGWVELPMNDLGDNLYGAEIPGQTYGSLVKYYLTGEDVGGHAASDPPGAPWEAYEFWVLPPIFTEAFEEGAGDWVHYVVIDTMNDQWHLSEQRNHTPGGSWSWKFGDTGDGDYTDLADGALESPPIEVDGDITLAFWHWMDAEVSQAYEGYAYDGGLVEMSLDGGPWTQIAPVGGYPYRVREGGILGPFPAETPIYSGSHDWQEARFELDDLLGVVRFRFRFGSDGAVTAEGWFIDDVEIISSSPGVQEAEIDRPLPRVLALHPCRPNPCGARSAGTRIRFDLPQPAWARLEIFDIGGRRVRELVSGALPAGRHEVAWDACGPRGQRLDSGVYFYVLRIADRRLAGRVLLVH